MTNNLVQVKKDLKSFAKKCKNFKYTDSALLTFLLNGMLITFGTENLFAESVTKSDINNQVSSINTSIGNLRTDFKRARAENNKLIKDTNLELTQLMEQGDHVVKSPWSSWQYGANTILNDWHGSYKGRGDKKEKYPYEGILKRDSNAYNRYISKESSMYQYLPQSSDPRSASTNSRNGYSSYGLASNKTVPEPPVSFEISASIKPRIVNKGAITVPAPAALQPTLPKAIDFKPVTPMVTTPTAPTITLSTPPSILFNGQGFGQPGGASLPQSNIIMQNWGQYTPDAPINVTVNTSSTTWSGGNIAVSGGAPSTSLTPGNSSSSLNAFISHVDDRDVDVQGTYNVTSDKSGFPLFISLNPYNYG